MQKSNTYLDEDLAINFLNIFTFYKSPNCGKLYILLYRYFSTRNCCTQKIVFVMFVENFKCIVTLHVFFEVDLFFTL